MPATPRRKDSAPNERDAVDRDSFGALVNLGVAPATAAEYLSHDDPEGAVFDAVLLPGRLTRTVTPAAIESRGGLRVAEVAELMEAFGLPRPDPDEPAFSPEEAQALVELGRLEELWPPELRVQVARASGAMLATVARAELQAFEAYTAPHVRERGAGVAAQLRGVQAAFAQLLPLADPLLRGVHRRWIEHELAQRAVHAAELHGSTDALPGAVEVTFLFCDLKDFTAYAEASGDAAAIATVDHFFEVVAHERGQGGRFVKSLGDGAMLVYDDPVEAVAGGARVIVAMRSTTIPGVHASVHQGVAIARSGDYFGGAVNLAARLLAFAGREELIASSHAVEGCRQAFRWTPAGERAVRGLAVPLPVYKLASVGDAAKHGTAAP